MGEAVSQPAQGRRDKREQRDAGALRIEVLEGRDAFGALEKEWNAALLEGPHDEPMLRHEWLRAWLEYFAPSAPLRIFVAREGKRLCAALPLVETRTRDLDTCMLPMTTWATPTNEHSQRGGFLLGARGLEALAPLFARIVSAPGWDRLRLHDLPEGAPEWRLRGLADELGYPAGLWISLRSPTLTLPAPAAVVQKGPLQKAGKGDKADRQDRFAQVEARLDAKFRANLRRRRRRLEETGKVQYRVIDGRDAGALDSALADLFELEASGWKGREGTAIAQRPELVGYYTQLARDAAKRGALALGVLSVSDKPIAAHLSLVHAGRAYLLKLGYDESLKEFSPGQQLTADALRDACARGLSEFDFLGPDMPWKDDWEPALRTHSWLTIFRPTAAGKLVHGARFTAWPVARALWRRVQGGAGDSAAPGERA